MLLSLMWLGVITGMVTLITAAMRVQESGRCKGYKIQITGFRPDMLFTTEDQIAALLKAAGKGEVAGQKKSDFNLPLMEDLLEQSAWVYNADLYFDNNNFLHANVMEREPMARIFTTTGSSFYIDEAGKRIPLSDQVSLDLPVFTGYVSKKIMDAADSVLLQNMIATASFISSDSFWNAQVAQVDIRNCGADCWSMEMIPVVGSHKVDLGDGSDIASKFHRLFLFYDQVLKRTGFDKYSKIDVQYDGQVIGVKGDYDRVDSLQLRKNIEHLLAQSRKTNEMLQVAPTLPPITNMPTDTSIEARGLFINPLGEELVVTDSETGTVAAIKRSETASESAKPQTGKSTAQARPGKKPESGKATTKKTVAKQTTDSKKKDTDKKKTSGKTTTGKEKKSNNTEKKRN
ncbi:hypothetical protein GCM10027051_07580 [Niabella terrae]